MNDMLEAESFSLVPRTFAEAMEFAKMMADTDIVPKDFRGKPGNIIVAVQLGREVGLPPVQALWSIAVINGRPAIWGDGLWALVKAHPLCESTNEIYDDVTMTATCTIVRRGSPPVIRQFSKADAERAGLWSKEGPWKNYPKRMLQMRARGFACRDAIPEALKGLSMAEEARDMGAAERVDLPQALHRPPEPDQEPAPPPPPPAEPQPDEKDFDPMATLVTTNMLSVLNAKLADQNLKAEFCKHFHIADPSELRRSLMNGALDWIRQQRDD